MEGSPGQVTRPLAPSSRREHDEEDHTTQHMLFGLNKLGQKRKCIRCCCFATFFFFIQVIIFTIIVFIVFRVKGSVMKMKLVHVNRLELINGTMLPRPGTNMSFVAELSVKNRNSFVSFLYANTTTNLYYNGAVIGEVRSPSRLSKARHTMKMNITVDIIIDNVISSPNFDVNFIKRGLLNLTSYTRVGGRVTMFGFIKRHMVVKMNCTLGVNITRKAIQRHKCRRKIKL